MRRSLDGRRMAWWVLRRCCRPTVDTFIAVLLFGVGGTLLTMLWTFEPRLTDERAVEEEVQRQLVNQFLHEKEQLRNELDRLNNNDLRLLDGSSNDRLQGSNRRNIESRKRRTRFDVGYIAVNDDKLPEIELQNIVWTRTPKLPVQRTVSQSIVFRTGRARLDNDLALSVNSSDDRFLHKVRLKLLSDVTSKPEVDRRTQHSNKTQLVLGDRLNNSFVGSRRWCSVYNTTPKVPDSFDCIRLLIKPPTTVCLHPDAEDVHVSRHLREDGLWEPHIVRLLQNLLFQNPDLGLIDIGANIGQYSLLAATMGRRVVAVEPHPPNLRRLHKAIKINNVEQQVR